jgi:hypothetical protein
VTVAMNVVTWPHFKHSISAGLSAVSGHIRNPVFPHFGHVYCMALLPLKKDGTASAREMELSSSQEGSLLAIAARPAALMPPRSMKAARLVALPEHPTDADD